MQHLVQAFSVKVTSKKTTDLTVEEANALNDVITEGKIQLQEFIQSKTGCVVEVKD